jgi:hypothetical protein
MEPDGRLFWKYRSPPVHLAPEGFGFRPPRKLSGFIEFGAATFRAGASEPQRPRHEAGLLGPLAFRPMVFRRNDIGWMQLALGAARLRADMAERLARNELSDFSVL